jgi:hypothetical protein
MTAWLADEITISASSSNPTSTAAPAPTVWRNCRFCWGGVCACSGEFLVGNENSSIRKLVDLLPAADEMVGQRGGGPA